MRRTRANRNGLTLLELLVVLTILISLGTLIIPTVSYLGRRSQGIATLESMRRLQELILNKYKPDMGELPRPADFAVTAGRTNHPQLCYLFVNPDTHEDGDSSTTSYDRLENVLSSRCWRGPYIMHSGAEYYITDVDGDPATGDNFTNRYGEGNEATEVGDPTIIDAWGRPIVIQEPDADDDGSIDENEYRHVRLVSAGRNGIIDTPPDVLMPTDGSGTPATDDQRGDDLILFLFIDDQYGDGLQGLKEEQEWK